MISIGQIFKARDYYYFNENQALKVKTLTPFQVIWRKTIGYLLGHYQETHLNHVAKNAYLFTLTDAASSHEAKPLFQVFSKVKKTADITLFEFTEGGRSVKIKPDFEVASGEQTFSKVGFKFAFSGQDVVDHSFALSISKSNDKYGFIAYKTSFLRDAIPQTASDTDEHLRELRKHVPFFQDTLIINDIAARIIVDSSLPELTSELTPYEALNNPFPTTANRLLRESINNTYGWEFSHDVRDSNYEPTSKVYCVSSESNFVKTHSTSMLRHISQKLAFNFFLDRFKAEPLPK